MNQPTPTERLGSFLHARAFDALCEAMRLQCELKGPCRAFVSNGHYHAVITVEEQGQEPPEAPLRVSKISMALAVLSEHPTWTN